MHRLWASGRRRYHPARLLGVWLIELVGTPFGVPSARRPALPRASGDLNRSASREHAAKRAVGSPRGCFLFWPAHTWASFQRPPATTRHAFLAAASSALERYRCTAPRRALCFPRPVYVAASRLAEPVGCEPWAPWRLSAADTTCARRRNARVDTLPHPLGDLLEETSSSTLARGWPRKLQSPFPPSARKFSSYPIKLNAAVGLLAWKREIHISGRESSLLYATRCPLDLVLRRNVSQHSLARSARSHLCSYSSTK